MLDPIIVGHYQGHGGSAATVIVSKVNVTSSLFSELKLDNMGWTGPI